MRSQGGVASNAPTDTTGATAIGAQIRAENPADYRFLTLIGLILSAQTKDPDTAMAVANLRHHFADKGGCTARALSFADPSTVLSLIRCVTFAERKVEYIQKVADTCCRLYKGDIPRTKAGLCALPGVGPKVAYLTLQHAWNDSQGIGVDVHVHRIANRLGWAHATDPDETRKQLQEWLPREYWAPLNALFVGFGQTVCRMPFPLCEKCEVNAWCPVGRHRLGAMPSADAKKEPAAAAAAVAVALYSADIPRIF
jgi:endonuclease-3